MSDVRLILGDCLEILPTLEDQSINAIITDLPYGTTACSWDEIIPFEPMWEQVRRLLKPWGVFITTASQPFTSKLVMSNLEWFKYEWIWDKKKGSNFLTVKTQPFKEHENILVFYNKIPTYNPMKIPKTGNRHKRAKDSEYQTGKVYGNIKGISWGNIAVSDLRPPKSIIIFPAEANNQYKKQRFHPTQKPVALYEYLILTYSNPQDTILDFCFGSGSTGVACVKTNRNFIGMEIKSKYYDIAEKRIKQAQRQMVMDL